MVWDWQSVMRSAFGIVDISDLEERVPSLHILWLYFWFLSLSQVTLSPGDRSHPHTLSCPLPLINTPDKHFTNVAAHLKLCLLMLRGTCEQTEKDWRTPGVACRDLSASATYVIVGREGEKITLSAIPEAPKKFSMEDHTVGTLEIRSNGHGAKSLR
jgi:hypothetical protein